MHIHTTNQPQHTNHQELKNYKRKREREGERSGPEKLGGGWFSLADLRGKSEIE